MNKEKIEISVNEEDVQNIINCYEKDIEYIKQLEQENQQLKEIINKAIEYIKERTEFNQYSEVYPSVLDAREVKKILEILKGGSNE